MVGYLATLPAHAVCLTADRDFYIHANSSATYYRQFFRVLQHKSRCCRAPFGAFGIGNLSRYTASFNQVNLDWLATSQRVIALEIKVKGTNGDFAKAQRALAMVRSESNHLRLRAQGALMAALICAGENMLRGFAFGVLSILKSDYTQTSSAFTTTRLTSSGLIAILVLVNELATVHINGSLDLTDLNANFGRGDEVLEFRHKHTDLIRSTCARVAAVAQQPLLIMLEVACYLLVATAEPAPLAILQRSVLRSLAKVCVPVPTASEGWLLSSVPFLTAIYGCTLPDRGGFLSYLGLALSQYFGPTATLIDTDDWGRVLGVICGQISAPASPACIEMMCKSPNGNGAKERTKKKTPARLRLLRNWVLTLWPTRLL
jgi:hypothetical protein